MADYAYPKALTGMQDTQWSNFMLNITDDGATSDSAFTPSANGAGMVVTLAPGEALVRGTLTGDASAASVTIPAAPASGSGLSRIDTIVKRLDRSGTPVIKTAVVSGNAVAGTPAAPTLTQSATGVWEWPVANVAVAAGAVSIVSANITDRRTFAPLKVGAWKTRPANPRAGQLGLNRTSGKWEYFDGGQWLDLISSVSWSSIAGKPSSFPTDWASVSGKPTTFPPVAHRHPYSDIYVNSESETITEWTLKYFASIGRALDETPGTLSISKGGTGATTAMAALNALGIFVQPDAPANVAGRVWIKSA
jgi:hypothetical protein